MTIVDAIFFLVFCVSPVLLTVLCAELASPYHYTSETPSVSDIQIDATKREYIRGDIGILEFEEEMEEVLEKHEH